MERIQRNSLSNGWPQNQLLTAFTPSRVMCKSIVLCDNKTFSLTLRRTYGELVLSRIYRVSSSYDTHDEFAECERSLQVARWAACNNAWTKKREP